MLRSVLPGERRDRDRLQAFATRERLGAGFEATNGIAGHCPLTEAGKTAPMPRGGEAERP